jgi:hypothetical protein
MAGDAKAISTRSADGDSPCPVGGNSSDAVRSGSIVDRSQNIFQIPRLSVPQPDFFVDSPQVASGYQFQRLLVRQTFGLKVGEMSEDPNVPQFVGDGRAQFAIVQRAEKSHLERNLIRSGFCRAARYRSQARVGRDYRNGDTARNSQPIAEILDNQVDLLFHGTLPSHLCSGARVSEGWDKKQDDAETTTGQGPAEKGVLTEGGPSWGRFHALFMICDPKYWKG